MNDLTYLQWITDGLGGLVNMAEYVAAQPVKPSEAQVDKLGALIDRLRAVQTKLTDKVV